MTRNQHMGVGEALRRYWTSHAVQINDGVSTETLESFQNKHGVLLPIDLRDYFLSVNGMAPEETDDALIRFWMIEELQAISEGAPEYASSNYVEDPESLFLFADFSLWAHAYAIRLKAAPSETNEVFLIGWDSSISLFPSFHEFVQSYLTNKERLFPRLEPLTA